MDDSLDNIIIKSFEGELGESEQAVLDNWLNKDERNPLIYQELANFWSEGKDKNNSLRANIWGKFLQKAGEEKNKFSSSPIQRVHGEDCEKKHGKNKVYLPFFKPFLKVAAVVLFIVSSGYFVVYQHNKQNGAVAEIAEGYREKINPPGQKSTIKLNDGTLVRLNADSKLKVPKDFGMEGRTVFLEGEAFFDVAKDPTKPFTIYAGDLRTEVKGTSFNVEAYPSHNNVKVAVLTGLVKVTNNVGSPPIAGVMLNPDEMVVYHKASDLFATQNFEYDEIFGWKDDMIVFNQASFDEIEAKLSQWYGVDFETHKEINLEKGFSGKYKNESLENVLKAIGFACGFSFEINEKTVIIL